MSKRVLGFVATNFKQDVWLYAPVMAASLFLATALIGSASLSADRFLIMPGLIGDRTTLFQVVFVGFGLNIINLLVSLFILERDRLTAYLISFGALFVSMIICLKVATILYFW